MPHYKQPNKGMKRLDISTGAGEGGGKIYPFRGFAALTKSCILLSISKVLINMQKNTYEFEIFYNNYGCQIS